VPSTTAVKAIDRATRDLHGISQIRTVSKIGVRINTYQRRARSTRGVKLDEPTEAEIERRHRLTAA
jgi:hypothetical protein